jgi:hypothetical protein
MGPIMTPGTSTAISETVVIAHENRGEKRWKTSFRLTATPVAVTDGAASGSHGALLLGTLMEGAILFGGSLQNYTAITSDSALTTAAGDAVLEIGVGSTAIAAAADGTLAAANDNIGNDVDVTLSSNSGSGEVITGAGASHNGTGTACPIYLNVSGTAATVDASGYVYLTGKIDVIWELLVDN